MRPEDHPAHRPTRYYWAAGLNPLHWVPALGAWLAVFLLAVTAVSVPAVHGAINATPFIAIAALGWSGLWLIVMPNTKRFKRATDAKLQEQYAGDYQYRLLEYKDRINPDLQGKVQEIGALRDKTREMLASKFGDSDPFAKDNLVKLDKLAISYLQMLVTLTEYDQYISLVDPESISRDLEAAQAATAQSEASLRDIGQRQVDLLQNRLTRYKKANEGIQAIRGQIKNVETTMKLLLDTAMTVADPKRVGRDMDTVLKNIHDSEVLSAELASYDEMERDTEYARVKEGL